MRERVFRVFGAASALLDRSRRPSAVDLALFLVVAAAAIRARAARAPGRGRAPHRRGDRPLPRGPPALRALLPPPRPPGLRRSRSSSRWSTATGPRRIAARSASWSRCSTCCRAFRSWGSCPGWSSPWSPLFPRSNVGLELAAIVMIFTGQAWNMTFSFYHSVEASRTISAEVAALLPLRGVAALHAASSCRPRRSGSSGTA